MVFPHSLVDKESICNAGDPGLIPRLGRSPREGIGYPLQYSWASLVAQLVKNPSTCNAGDLGLIPVLGRFPQRRESLLTPVFWLREFHGLCSWGHKESETTEQLFLSLSHEYSTRRKTEGSCRLHSFLVANHIYGRTLIKQITLVSSGKRIGLIAERCGRWACH